MSKPIIAAQTYTIHPHIKTDEDFVVSMKKLKDIGFNVVQLSGHGNVSIPVITKTLKELDLQCCITHSSFERIRDDFETIVKEHQDWGCKVIGIGGVPGGYSHTVEDLNRFIKDANEIGNKLSAYGMKFAYHNHSFEFKRVSGQTKIMDMFLDGFNENVEFIPDYFWLQHGGVNVYEWLYKYKGRTSTVHFKDYSIDPQTNQPDVCEIGYGNMDYVKLAKITEEIGATYAAIEQDASHIDRFDSIEMSFKYMRDVLGMPTK